MNVSGRAYGLYSAASEEVGNGVKKEWAYLYGKVEQRLKMENMLFGNRREMLREIEMEENNRVPSETT